MFLRCPISALVVASRLCSLLNSVNSSNLAFTHIADAIALVGRLDVALLGIVQERESILSRMVGEAFGFIIGVNCLAPFFGHRTYSIFLYFFDTVKESIFSRVHHFSCKVDIIRIECHVPAEIS